MSRIVKCTTTNVSNQVEYQGDNYSDCCCHNQQAVPVELGPETSVDNGQIHNVVATRKSCRVKRIPRRLIE